MVKFNPLGNSGLIVSSLCLGTMVFGENNERGTSPKDAERIIHAYLDAGGNHIDTANVYASGESERIIGKALKTKRDQVVLATKVRFAMGDGINDQGLSRVHIQNSVEASLKRLETNVIDLLYMHCWDPITPIEESLRAFDDLVRAGKVRYIGVSNFTAWQMMKTLDLSETKSWAGFIAAQYQYSLVERNIEDEISPLCKDQGLSLTPWGPLGGGFLSGKYQPGDRPTSGRIATMPENTEESWQRRNIQRNWDILAVVDEIAKSRGASHAQIALAWVMAQPAVGSTIMGVRTMEQLEDNLAADEIELSPDELKRLGEISKLPPRYPYRFIKMYGSR
jgi:aryl-alcohol dehydrogenase-like predicted oxidoreductase